MNTRPRYTSTLFVLVLTVSCCGCGNDGGEKADAYLARIQTETQTDSVAPSTDTSEDGDTAAASTARHLRFERAKSRERAVAQQKRAAAQRQAAKRRSERIQAERARTAERARQHPVPSQRRVSSGCRKPSPRELISLYRYFRGGAKDIDPTVDAKSVRSDGRTFLAANVIGSDPGDSRTVVVSYQLASDYSISDLRTHNQAAADYIDASPYTGDTTGDVQALACLDGH